MTDPLVTAEWLAANLDDVVVLDATYYLPPDPSKSRSDFETARIPGARLFEIDEIANRTSGLPHMLPDETLFSEAMAALGIDGTKPVVVYDRSASHFSAPRVWFTLRLFGLKEAYVLEGGLNAWTNAGHPTDSGSASHEPAAPVNWTLDRDRVLSGRQMAERVAAGNETIFDARSQDRFDGTAPEPRPGISSGHMTGATCTPFTALTNDEGGFAGADQLRTIFAAVDKSDPIVTCGSGMTACVLALGLERIGIKARLYDGSWVEWGSGELGEISAKA